MERDERSCWGLMSAKLLVDASNYSNRRKNDSFESGLEKIQKERRLNKPEVKKKKKKKKQDKNLYKVWIKQQEATFTHRRLTREMFL